MMGIFSGSGVTHLVCLASNGSDRQLMDALHINNAAASSIQWDFCATSAVISKSSLLACKVPSALSSVLQSRWNTLAASTLGSHIRAVTKVPQSRLFLSFYRTHWTSRAGSLHTLDSDLRMCDDDSTSNCLTSLASLSPQFAMISLFTPLTWSWWL